MFNLFKHELLSRWKMIFLWGLGLAAWGSIYITVYPDIAEEMSAFADMEMIAYFGMDMGSMEGYIASVVIQVLPIILGVYAIMLGTGTIAGEDDKGTLEMIVALPFKRWQVVAMKTLALLVLLFLIVVTFAAGEALVLEYVRNTTESDVFITLDSLALFIAMLGIFPLMVAVFGMSLFAGTVLPNKRIALAVMVAIYLGSYVANSAAGLVSGLEWVASLSIFHYVNTTADVFTDGLAASDVLTLLGVGALFFGLSLVSFAGRNITVGQWFWQRNQVPSR